MLGGDFLADVFDFSLFIETLLVLLESEIDFVLVNLIFAPFATLTDLFTSIDR